jgi:hypothetical protein
MIFFSRLANRIARLAPRARQQGQGQGKRDEKDFHVYNEASPFDQMQNNRRRPNLITLQSQPPLIPIRHCDTLSASLIILLHTHYFHTRTN